MICRGPIVNFFMIMHVTCAYVVRARINMHIAPFHLHPSSRRYIRGSARRAPDLRRAGLGGASCAIVLNYRSDKDAAAADTEVRMR